MKYRCVLLCVIASLSFTAGASARPWKLDDLAAYRQPFKVEVSPDGRRALVQIVGANFKTGEFTQDTDVLDLPSGALRPLLSDGKIAVARPQWSPDSTRVSFVAAGKSPQLDVVAAAGGKPVRVLVLRNRMVGYAWSPDGRTIAAVEAAAAAQGASQAISMFVNPDVDIAAANVPAQRTVWLIDVASGMQRRLVHDDYSYGGPATDHAPSWSADGREIALVRQPTPYYEAFERAQDVAVDVRTGAVRQIIDRPFFAYPDSIAPTFAPSSNSLALVHTWDGKLASREDVYIDGTDRSAPLDLDFWSCSGSELHWNGDRAYATALDGVASRLFDLGPGGTVRALTPRDGSVENFSVSRNGKVLMVYTTAEKPQEIYELTPSGLHQLTHIATLPSGVDVMHTVVLSWPDGAGHTLVGQVTSPPQGRNAPVIVEPHGGPQCSSDNGFNPFAQYYASNGYVYFQPDPRGSDGYGDWSYKAIVNDWGAAPMDDDMAGVDALLASGQGDPHKLFIIGASYGGYLTSWIVTHSNRFRAAVSGVPVTDLRLEYALSDSPNIMHRFFGMHPIADNSALLETQSPVHYAGQMNTPLLIISGLQDARAPYPQALEFYKALLDNGKDARMLVFPKAGHGPSDPLGVLDYEAHTVGWLAAHGGIAIPGAILPPP